MQTYKDLTVWQKSMDLTTKIYVLTRALPKEEIYGLTNQLRRAAVSIPSNIAEGNGRFSQKEYARFLSVARGSNAEVETQLLLCVKLGYIQSSETDEALSLCTEIGKMLTAMIVKFTT